MDSDVQHWHLSVTGAKDYTPLADLIFDNNVEPGVHFLDLCQAFFYHTFDMSRSEVEAKMARHILAKPDIGFVMDDTNFAVILFPCKGCKKGILN